MLPREIVKLTSVYWLSLRKHIPSYCQSIIRYEENSVTKFTLNPLIPVIRHWHMDRVTFYLVNDMPDDKVLFLLNIRH